MSKAELGLIQVLAGNHSEAKVLIREQLNMDLISDDVIKNLIAILLEKVQAQPAELVGQFATAGERELVTRILMQEDTLSDPFQMAKECLETLNQQPLKEELKTARLKIREMEAAGQDPTDLHLKVAEIQRELKTGI